MRKTLSPGARSGVVTAPASKSLAQRLLILSAAGEGDTRILCRGVSRDVEAVIRSLNALGAQIRTDEKETLFVRPIREVPDGLCRLPCGESAAALRFLLPFAGALGAQAVLLRDGRLPQRPMEPLLKELRGHGMTVEDGSEELICRGRLRSGSFTLPGNISSQFVSGLLMALPLLEGDSEICVRGPLESAGYVDLTLRTLRLAGIGIERTEDGFRIPGSRRPHLPATVSVEGDWSGAAAFLALGALSSNGIRVCGLDPFSAQGDARILELLTRMGAVVEKTEDSVSVRRGRLRGQTVDASQIPDLVPVLCALAAAAEGETRIVNGARLRLKESDRLRSTAAMLRSLGAEIEELSDGLVIVGKARLSGGVADCAGDHRVAMAAAVAAGACTKPITVLDADCVGKSYPGFWEDWDSLEGEGP